jgi:hypothetical protein
MDWIDWSVLKVGLESEERGFEIAISNAFHGKKGMGTPATFDTGYYLYGFILWLYILML